MGGGDIERVTQRRQIGSHRGKPMYGDVEFIRASDVAAALNEAAEMFEGFAAEHKAEGGLISAHVATAQLLAVIHFRTLAANLKPTENQDGEV